MTSARKKMSFADIVSSYITLNPETRPEHALVIELLDTPWFQRLRDISQTANTRLVYMFSEHSRFGHSLGVADLALRVLDHLLENHSSQIPEQQRLAVAAAALLHDIGHLAPGSHTAFRTWFPDKDDIHEELSCKIVLEDKKIRNILESTSEGLSSLVVSILKEDSSVPPWTWQLISGAGWNADRGNWCITDSVLAGVSYGTYNIPALIDSIELTEDGELALRENRLDAMMHFALSRQAMYRQIYQHRVLLAADCLCGAIAARARTSLSKDDFCDREMRKVLDCEDPRELELSTVFKMREHWWRYHLMCWRESKDSILSDLADRLISRRLFKTVRIGPGDDSSALLEQCQDIARSSGLEPEYYVHHIRWKSMSSGEDKNSMKVLSDHGGLTELSDADPVFSSLMGAPNSKPTAAEGKEWIVLPEQVKQELGRKR